MSLISPISFPSPKFQKTRNMEWSHNLKYLPIFFVFLVATILLCYHEDLTTTRFLLSPEQLLSNSSWPRRDDDLETVLEKAGSTDKTMIITVINDAYVEPSADGDYPSMFDLFLEGFWVGEETRPLLRRLLVVAMDRKAHERCLFRRLNCYLLVAEEGGGEKLYMSGEFVEMMWRRTGFLLDILNRGYHFIFTDSDVIWLRNPFTRLTNNETLDLQISTDKFNGQAWSEKNPINTGFYMIRSNSRTRSLFQKWYDLRANSTGMKEQDVLQNLIRDQGALRQYKVKAQFLDTKYFGGFCSHNEDVTKIVTIHANCCRTIKAKIVDLKNVLLDWRKMRGNSTTQLRWSAHTACVHSWSRKSLT